MHSPKITSFEKLANVGFKVLVGDKNLKKKINLRAQNAGKGPARFIMLPRTIS